MFSNVRGYDQKYPNWNDYCDLGARHGVSSDSIYNTKLGIGHHYDLWAFPKSFCGIIRGIVYGGDDGCNAKLNGDRL